MKDTDGSSTGWHEGLVRKQVELEAATPQATPADMPPRLVPKKQTDRWGPEGPIQAVTFWNRRCGHGAGACRTWIPKHREACAAHEVAA